MAGTKINELYFLLFAKITSRVDDEVDLNPRASIKPN